MMETIDVDLMFEKNTFENIEQIKNNLAENADKKKDELRQIIGQSYRELISLSGVIENMLMSCDNLSQDIGHLKNFCDQSKFSPSNKNNDQQQTSQPEHDRQLNELNLKKIRLKIIINSPNQILDSLNENDVLTAAVLYRRTKYLCNQFTDEEKRTFNTLIHQIMFLDKIYGLIYQKYLDLINYNNYTLNDQQLFRTLFAICLIKTESIDQVILEFLMIRSAQCLDLFKSQEDANSTLVVFFKIIFNTLEIVFNLYNSIDELSVSSITSQISAITIDYAFINRNEQKMLCHLFNEFKIENFIKNNENLGKKIEHDTCNWFEQIRSHSFDQIQQFLQTTSIDHLYESIDKVKQYFEEREILVLKSHYYEIICKKRIDFWDYFLSTPFDASWRYFLTSTIVRLFINFKNRIQYLQEEEETILNVFDYIWSNDLNENLNDMHKKYCGSTERIIELVNQTNEEFRYLIDTFLETNKSRKEMIHTGQKYKTFFYETFKQQNDEFLGYVEQLIKSKSLSKEQNFNLAHLIRMFVLICPNYKQCFDVLNMQSWFKVKEFLLNLSYLGYNSYINHIIDELVQLFYEEFERNQPLNCLHTSANWLEFEIKEQIDDGKEVSTNIYIPKQVSLPLENLITSLTMQLCRLSGHTLPNKLKLMILDELARSLCTGYKQIYDSMEKRNDQSLKATQTLQIYFDLLFLKSLFYHSLNDEMLKIELQTVLNQFQQHIDPFDLHLFSPYIQRNIECNKSNLAMIFSYLLPQTLHITSADHYPANIRERNFKLKFNFL